MRKYLLMILIYPKDIIIRLLFVMVMLLILFHSIFFYFFWAFAGNTKVQNWANEDIIERWTRLWGWTWQGCQCLRWGDCSSTLDGYLFLSYILPPFFFLNYSWTIHKSHCIKYNHLFTINIVIWYLI